MEKQKAPKGAFCVFVHILKFDIKKKLTYIFTHAEIFQHKLST